MAPAAVLLEALRPKKPPPHCRRRNKQRTTMNLESPIIIIIIQLLLSLAMVLILAHPLSQPTAAAELATTRSLTPGQLQGTGKSHTTASHRAGRVHFRHSRPTATSTFNTESHHPHRATLTRPDNEPPTQAPPTLVERRLSLMGHHDDELSFASSSAASEASRERFRPRWRLSREFGNDSSRQHERILTLVVDSEGEREGGSDDDAETNEGSTGSSQAVELSRPRREPTQALALSTQTQQPSTATQTGSKLQQPQPQPQLNTKTRERLHQAELAYRNKLMELKQRYKTNRAITDRSYYFLLIVYTSLITFGTISNSLICLTVILKPKILSPRNIFIVNLAGSDLLLCVFTMPLTFIEISMKIWQMGLIPCKLVAGLQATSIFVSTISITAIALDRYKVIVYPTHQETASGTRGAFLLLASVWIGALSLSLPLFTYRTVEHHEIATPQTQSDPFQVRSSNGTTAAATTSNSSSFASTGLLMIALASQHQQLPPSVAVDYHNNLTQTAGNATLKLPFNQTGAQMVESFDFCIEAWPFAHGRGIFSVISMILQYVLPITIVSVVYTKINRNLQKRLIRRQRLTQLECQQKRQLNLIKRTHTMLVSVSLVFGLSWLPLNLVNVVGDFSPAFRQLFSDDQSLRIIFAICHLIGCSSACSNPILYGFLNENFRKEFHQVYNHHARHMMRRFRRAVDGLNCCWLTRKMSKRCFGSHMDLGYEEDGDGDGDDDEEEENALEGGVAGGRAYLVANDPAHQRHQRHQMLKSQDSTPNSLSSSLNSSCYLKSDNSSLSSGFTSSSRDTLGQTSANHSPFGSSSSGSGAASNKIDTSKLENHQGGRDHGLKPSAHNLEEQANQVGSLSLSHIDNTTTQTQANATMTTQMSQDEEPKARSQPDLSAARSANLHQQTPTGHQQPPQPSHLERMRRLSYQTITSTSGRHTIGGRTMRFCLCISGSSSVETLGGVALNVPNGQGASNLTAGPQTNNNCELQTMAPPGEATAAVAAEVAAAEAQTRAQAQARVDREELERKRRHRWRARRRRHLRHQLTQLECECRCHKSAKDETKKENDQDMKDANLLAVQAARDYDTRSLNEMQKRSIGASQLASSGRRVWLRFLGAAPTSQHSKGVVAGGEKSGEPNLAEKQGASDEQTDRLEGGRTSKHLPLQRSVSGGCVPAPSAVGNELERRAPAGQSSNGTVRGSERNQSSEATHCNNCKHSSVVHHRHRSRSPPSSRRLGGRVQQMRHHRRGHKRMRRHQREARAEPERQHQQRQKQATVDSNNQQAAQMRGALSSVSSWIASSFRRRKSPGSSTMAAGSSGQSQHQDAARQQPPVALAAPDQGQSQHQLQGAPSRRHSSLSSAAMAARDNQLQQNNNLSSLAGQKHEQEVARGKQVGTVYLSIEMPRKLGRDDSIVSLEAHEKSTSVVVLAGEDDADNDQEDDRGDQEADDASENPKRHQEERNLAIDEAKGAPNYYSKTNETGSGEVSPAQVKIEAPPNKQLDNGEPIDSQPARVINESTRLGKRPAAGLAQAADQEEHLQLKDTARRKGAVSQAAKPTNGPQHLEEETKFIACCPDASENTAKEQANHLIKRSNCNQPQQQHKLPLQVPRLERGSSGSSSASSVASSSFTTSVCHLHHSSSVSSNSSATGHSPTTSLCTCSSSSASGSGSLSSCQFNANTMQTTTQDESSNSTASQQKRFQNAAGQRPGCRDPASVRNPLKQERAKAGDSSPATPPHHQRPKQLRPMRTHSATASLALVQAARNAAAKLNNETRQEVSLAADQKETTPNHTQVTVQNMHNGDKQLKQATCSSRSLAALTSAGGHHQSAGRQVNNKSSLSGGATRMTNVARASDMAAPGTNTSVSSCSIFSTITTTNSLASLESGGGVGEMAMTPERQQFEFGSQPEQQATTRRPFRADQNGSLR